MALGHEALTFVSVVSLKMAWWRPGREHWRHRQPEPSLVTNGLGFIWRVRWGWGHRLSRWLGDGWESGGERGMEGRWRGCQHFSLSAGWRTACGNVLGKEKAVV